MGWLCLGIFFYLYLWSWYPCLYVRLFFFCMLKSGLIVSGDFFWSLFVKLVPLSLRPLFFFLVCLKVGWLCLGIFLIFICEVGTSVFTSAWFFVCLKVGWLWLGIFLIFICEVGTSVFTSASSSQRRFRPSDWSTSSESYMGSTNSRSVVARRSALGVQMCSVIHVCESSHSNHTQDCWRVETTR